MVTSFAAAREQADDGLQLEFLLALSRADLALIIDALLKAEMAQSIIDDRHRHLGSSPHMRARQIALAERLDGLLAVGAQDHAATTFLNGGA